MAWYFVCFCGPDSILDKLLLIIKSTEVSNPQVRLFIHPDPTLDLRASVFHSTGLAAPGYVEYQFPRVFLGLLRPIVFRIAWSVTDLTQDRVRCTCPYHLSYRLRRTAVISAMPSFWSSEAEGVSSQSLVTQIQLIMNGSLRQSRCKSGVFGPHHMKHGGADRDHVYIAA